MVLTPKEDLVKRIDKEELGNYTQVIISSLSDYITKENEHFADVKQAILQFELNPKKSVEIKIAFRPVNASITNTIKQEIRTIIQKIPVPLVKEGKVEFQIYFTPKVL
jgi:hypothetical protein